MTTRNTENGTIVLLLSYMLRALTIVLLKNNQCCNGFLPQSGIIQEVGRYHPNGEMQAGARRKHRIGSSIMISTKEMEEESNAMNMINNNNRPLVRIAGYTSKDDEQNLKNVLTGVGFRYVDDDDAVVVAANCANHENIFTYKYIKATGMLKLVEGPMLAGKEADAPKWIPVQKGEENVLAANGWSFLDPDESEPLSAFDVDAANEEGQYKPKWGYDGTKDGAIENTQISSFGFDLTRMPADDIRNEAEKISVMSRTILLDGGTEEPNTKRTNNGYDFSGSVTEEDVEKGMFVCAIYGLPLFSTADLSPSTASSGWLSFSNPMAEDHIEHIHPEDASQDRRVEVICARTGCHLGHYFGTGEGYCINASALNFLSANKKAIPDAGKWDVRTNPISWLDWNKPEDRFTPSQRIARTTILNHIIPKEICLGAGCFWHVEFALRRLPGVIDTAVGYSGGNTVSPTYKQVCHDNTNHAEVVKLRFDPSVLSPRKLIDCFLAMHDPTVVRAHGKRARESGQYRSCIFVYDEAMESVTLNAISECTNELRKVLCTEVRFLENDNFWLAEDRHQRHDERVKDKFDNELCTLSLSQWLLQYGRRSSSIWGSSSTQSAGIVDDSNDDGMARMMI